MTARPTKRSRSRGAHPATAGEIDLSKTLVVASLPPVPVRRGVPVEVQAREYVERLGLPEIRRAGVLLLVECEIAERLPKGERPDWFETDDEILVSL